MSVEHSCLGVTRRWQQLRVISQGILLTRGKNNKRARVEGGIQAHHHHRISKDVAYRSYAIEQKRILKVGRGTLNLEMHVLGEKQGLPCPRLHLFIVDIETI